MSEAIIIAIITIVSNVITGLVTHWTTKKKYNTEVDSNLIENMKNSLEFYKKLSDDNQARLEAVLERNEKLEARNDKLETEIAELRKTVMTMVSSICLDLSCILRKRDLHLIAHPEDIEKTLEENANNG